MLHCPGPVGDIRQGWRSRRGRRETEALMRSVSRVGRVAAFGAVVVAVVLVGIVLFGGGGGYTVSAVFQNAGQIVKGNLVEVAGVQAGSVKGISITPNGALTGPGAAPGNIRYSRDT